VYVRTVEEQELNFQVSGMLWRRSLVMRDLETKTLWSHLLGRGMKGTHKGVTLEMLPATMTSWKDWKQRHPETTLLAMSRTADRYLEEVWERPERFVFGIPPHSGGKAASVSVKRLQTDSPVVVTAGNRKLVVTLTDSGGSIQAFHSGLGDRELTFSEHNPGQMKDAETGSIWDTVRGTALSGELEGRRLAEVPGTISFQKAWEMFFPESVQVR
jgi:hypothetical protein